MAIPVIDLSNIIKWFAGSGTGTQADPYALTITSSATVSGAVDTELTTADLDTSGGTDTRAVIGLVYAESGGAVLVSTAAPLPVIDSGSAGAGKNIKVAPTVTASSAYTSGNSIGGKLTLALAVRVSGGKSILTGIHLLDRANQKPVGTILIFDADPTAATLTDKTAFAYSTDDLKQVASVPVVAGDWVTINSKAVAYIRNLGGPLADVQAVSGTTLYASFVTTSTPTFAAATDVQMIFDFIYVN